MHIKPEAGLQFGFAISYKVWRLGHIKGRLLLSVSQRPSNATIKASFTRRNRILKLWREVKCKVQTSQCCLDTDFKRYTQIQAVLPTCLAIALSRMSWIWVSDSCTLKTWMTPPSESWRRAIVSTSAVLIWKITYPVSTVAWAAAPMPV